jgi:LmbE family N-acetylglucosaminyl deacetylase
MNDTADVSAKHRRVLAFMAHPDDAEFSCVGTLILLAQAGWEVHIATAACGDCGTTTETPWGIAAKRYEEARQAAGLIGGTYHSLGEHDGLVVYDKPTAQKCTDLFRRISPSLVFIHSPVDYMMDHIMASLLGRAASFIFLTPNASAFPLTAGLPVPYLYYCDPLEGIDPLGHPVEPTTYVDISAVLEEKSRMLACHASQREWLRAQHGMDEYLDSMRRHSQMRGKQAGMAAAEAFVQHRGHAYPKDDLLAKLFGAAGPRAS